MNKIADLYIALGIQGAGKTIKALDDTGKGLKGLASLSLEVKAALLAAAYAMEKLMMGSAKAGSALQNFEAVTGLSTKKLQEWQYAGQQVGVAADDVAGSIKSVQGAMTKMLMNEGAPKGLALVANATKNFDVNRVRDTYYVMDQLQKAAQKLPKDLGNEALKSFGLSEGVIAGMRRNAFRPEVFKKADTYSSAEQQNLDKTNAGFANLQQRIEMMFGHFTAKHGPGFVENMMKMTDAVIRLIEAFIKLGDKLKIFDSIAKLAGIISDPISKLADFVNSATDVADKPSVAGAKKLGKSALNTAAGFTKYLPGGPTSGIASFLLNSINNQVNAPKAQKALSPKSNKSLVTPKGLPPVTGNKNQQNTFNQTLNFQGSGDDHKKTSDATKKAVQDAYRQMGAQSQGT